MEAKLWPGIDSGVDSICQLVGFLLCSTLKGFFPGYSDFCPSLSAKNLCNVKATILSVTLLSSIHSPSISETNRKWKTAKEETKRETNSKRAR